MSKSREEFHEYLKSVTDIENIYFQSPAGLRMKYPAIIYSRDNIDNTFANNNVYNQAMVYPVTVIDSNPDSELVSKVSKIPTSRYNRHYTADNLNHDVFTLTF